MSKRTSPSGPRSVRIHEVPDFNLTAGPNYTVQDFLVPGVRLTDSVVPVPVTLPVTVPAMWARPSAVNHVEVCFFTIGGPLMVNSQAISLVILSP